MLTGKNILLMGGDFRQKEVIKTLASLQATVYLIGFDELEYVADNVIYVKNTEAAFNIMDGILLPIPGVNDSGEIESSFSSSEIFFTNEMLEQTKEDCVIYTGIITPFLHQLVEKTNRKLVALFHRDDVAVLNSIPTAEGALMLAIQHTAFTVHHAKVMVLGFGRVGTTVARVFSAVGAKVSVCVRKPADAARVKEMGLTPVFMQNLSNITAEINIFLNTIPFCILDAAIISRMSKDTLIIDLASKPGGTDFAFAKEKGIKTIWALGLPAKVAPKTAGEIIGNVLSELMQEA
ncbi:dipicolinate synthase subunit DpsA [Niallia sp. 03091]|uniref:dipicolinate synthase subunit DpsA n=1 Tax=unclassified Niallia TaxID=2837522 RepID=UPI0040445585